MPTQQQNSRRYFIKTYGCQMNVADSAKLAAVLEAAGYTAVSSIDELVPVPGPQSPVPGPSILLINTCVVRQNAEDRAAWYITSAKGLKKDNPNLKIGLCGCLVSEPGRDVRKQFPHVDFFIPPNSPESLRDALRRNTKSEIRNSKQTEQVRTSNFEIASDFGIRHSNFVSIMTGCDNFCSYCIVPYVRGRETSRPMNEVLAEVKEIWGQGARGPRGQGTGDITLLGQNVNSYKFGFAKLLREIGEIAESRQPKAEHRISFMTSHPKDMTDEIIETVAALPYVAKDFHLPLQSGDDEILKQMNRGYTVEYFKGRVAKIRSLLPPARVSTDLMVGFPGETEAQFEISIKLVKEIGFTQVNMFAYSGRPETAASKLAGQVPAEVKQERLQRLIEANRRWLRT